MTARSLPGWPGGVTITAQTVTLCREKKTVHNILISLYSRRSYNKRRTGWKRGMSVPPYRPHESPWFSQRPVGLAENWATWPNFAH